jgi:hypothetical protein
LFGGTGVSTSVAYHEGIVYWVPAVVELVCAVVLSEFAAKDPERTMYVNPNGSVLPSSPTL